MALLPRYDFADPVRVRNQMDRNLKLSRAAGLSRVTDERVEKIVDRDAASAHGPSVPVRCYFPRDRAANCAAIIYFHGGAFVTGDLDFEHSRCLEMAGETGSIVISADYRLAPEHPYPAGVNDCCAAYEWTLATSAELGIDTSRVALAGASAGGALAAAVALIARDRKLSPPAFQLLLYPVTDDRMTTASMALFEDIPGWNSRNAGHMWRLYLGDAAGGAETPGYAAPARAGDLRRLPPAYIMTAEIDALRDEGIVYAQMLMDAGVSVELHHYPGAFHGFDTLTETECSRAARAEHYACLRAALAPRAQSNNA